MLPTIKDVGHPEISKVIAEIVSLRKKCSTNEGARELIEHLKELEKSDYNLALIFALLEVTIAPCPDFTFGILLTYKLLREQDVINQCAELESIVGMQK